jgi:acyl-[acyl-carrier-protein] desaturase
VLRHWHILDRTDFGPEGGHAREQLAAFLQGLDAQATKFVDRREENRARVAARDDGVQQDIVAS